MNVVFVGPNLQKLQLIPGLKGQTDLLENTVNGLVENSATILRRKNQVIEKNKVFEEVSLALMNVITDVERVQPQQSVEVSCEGDRLEVLLVEWLNALIFEMATTKMLFSRFDVTIDGGKLRAQAWGEPIDFLRHELIVEVKGATYTELKVEQEPDGRWIAQCVVDV